MKKDIKNKNMVTIYDPQSMVSESYRMLRTNLNYMNVDKENKVILFTSTTSGEGKTTSTCNAAVTFAQAGKKVLLIESDLRKARIHEMFQIKHEPGLTNILAFKKPLSEVVQTVEGVNNLHILTSGPLPPDPAELLTSNAYANFIQEVKEAYDIVLIDAPPTLGITDAVIISKLVDGVILVVASKETKKESAKQAKKALEIVGANILGVLLTKDVVKKHSSYYYYYGKSNKKQSKRK